MPTSGLTDLTQDDEVEGSIPFIPVNARDALSGFDFSVEQQDFGADQADADKNYFTKLADLYKDKRSLGHVFSSLNLDNVEYDGTSSFAQLRQLMTDLIGDGGLMKLVRTHGAGEQIPPESTACIHYVGHLEHHDDPFDSTYLRKRAKPERHLVGKDSQLISGLNTAILSMKKGETSYFLISPQYAFGSLGCVPRIPQDTDVLFEVTLLGWSDTDETDSYDMMTASERAEMTFERRLDVIRSLHSTGNDHFREREYSEASKLYRKAIFVFRDMRFADEWQHDEAKKLIFDVMSNRVQCLNSLCMWKQACIQSREAFAFDDVIDRQKLRKLYLRYSKAMIHLAEYSQAEIYLRRASRICSKGDDLSELVSLLSAQQQRNKVDEIKFARRAMNTGEGKGESHTDGERGL